jgi:hypothetical protein
MVAQVGIGEEILDRPLDDIQVRSVSLIHHCNLALQYGENAEQIGVIFMQPPQYLRHADTLPSEIIPESEPARFDLAQSDGG